SLALLVVIIVFLFALLLALVVIVIVIIFFLDRLLLRGVGFAQFRREPLGQIRRQLVQIDLHDVGLLGFLFGRGFLFFRFGTGLFLFNLGSFQQFFQHFRRKLARVDLDDDLAVTARRLLVFRLGGISHAETDDEGKDNTELPTPRR